MTNVMRLQLKHCCIALMKAIANSIVGNAEEWSIN